MKTIILSMIIISLGFMLVNSQSVNIPAPATNYSLVNVNNSDYLDGFDSLYFYPDSNPDSFISDGNTLWDNSYNFWNSTQLLNGTLVQNTTLDSYAKYNFTTNNFNGSGNITTIGYIRAETGFSVGAEPIAGVSGLYLQSTGNASTGRAIYGKMTNTYPLASTTRGLEFTPWLQPFAMTGNIIATVEGIGIYPTVNNAESYNITVTNLNGFTSNPSAREAIESTGITNVTNVNHFKVVNVASTGGALVINQYGLYIPTLTTATNNWGIYSLTSQNNLTGTTYLNSTIINQDITTRNIQANERINTSNLTTTNILLPISNASTGIIYQNGTRLFHTYNGYNETPAWSNIFLGKNSGNFVLGGTTSTRGTGNVGIGADTLNDLTTGFYNFAIGTNSLTAVTTGQSNIGLGHQAGLGITEGLYNIFIGRDSGISVTTGTFNIGIGGDSLRTATGSNNIGIGANAGRYSTGSNKLFIDSLDRGNLSNGTTQSIIYGEMSSNVLFQNLTFNANTKVNGNLNISGNVTYKNPYWSGYDNSTQNFLNTANTQVINISNNNDIDTWQISVVGNQNLTFQRTGDYVCTLSPQFFQNGGGSIVTFWYQKNGVDVAWSNSRYSMSNNEYNAPAITYHFDILSVTDTIRFMWWSDSTSTQIYSSGALTTPTRPSVPGTILNCNRIGDVTI